MVRVLFLARTLSNDDDDGGGKENGKKAIGLADWQHNSARDHAFLYISLPSLLRRETA